MLPRTAARMQLLAAAFLFSTGGAAIKAADFGGWQIASFRSGIAAVALWFMTAGSRRAWSHRRAQSALSLQMQRDSSWHPVWQPAMVGLAYAGCLILFVLANRLTTAANTIFLQSTAPLYMLVLAPWLLKESVRRDDIGFMLAVGFGLALFFIGVEQPVATAPDPARGNVLALASGFCWALAVCGLRWLGAGQGRASPQAAVVLGNFLAFFLALPMALPVGSHSLADWSIIGYLGVFQIALAYVFVTNAIQFIPALEASVILLLEPVLNPLWAWLVQGEIPGIWALLGGAFILGATTYRSWSESRVAAPVT
jgi:drug/metabolite transporter (DMT)-like permease